MEHVGGAILTQFPAPLTKKNTPWEINDKLHGTTPDSSGEAGG